MTRSARPTNTHQIQHGEATAPQHRRGIVLALSLVMVIACLGVGLLVGRALNGPDRADAVTPSPAPTTCVLCGSGGFNPGGTGGGGFNPDGTGGGGLDSPSTTP